MKAMVLNHLVDLSENQNPLEFKDMPKPEPREHEILIKVLASGVCHTELDEIEGRTPPPSFPIIPGHQVIGEVKESGSAATLYNPGDRVGVAWVYSACGQCKYCRTGNENLCDDFQATGRDAHGGYAEYMKVPENFVYRIPDTFTDVEAAPLLCAGAIGYRSLKLTNLQNGENLGLTGFGASAHLVLKLVKYQYPDSNVYVFARNKDERAFARELGAVWAGETEEESPEKLAAIIDTTPVYKPVVEALENLAPGGRLVINAIRKEDFDKDYLLNLDYPNHLWMEKEIKSVANVARDDVRSFLHFAAQIPIKPQTQTFSLEEANKALLELKQQQIRGAKVLKLE